MGIRNYGFRFEFREEKYFTIMNANGHGDMCLIQKSPVISAIGIRFRQGEERVFFVSLLKYCHQYDLNIDYICDEEQGLLARLADLPDRAGNFAESPDGHYEEMAVSGDFCRFARGLDTDPELSHIISDGSITVDEDTNLWLQQEQYCAVAPQIYPPDAVKELLYGIIFLAAHGIIRSSRAQFENRIRYYIKNRDMLQKGARMAKVIPFPSQ